MVLYEVNLVIDLEIENDFLTWLEPHMSEVCLKGKFEKAKLYFEKRDGAHAYWVVQYHVQDQKTLDVYLNNTAPQLRQDAINRFGTQFTAHRRILT